jgi:hypothetical protein
MSDRGAAERGVGGDRRRLVGIVLSAAIVLVAALLATQGGSGGGSGQAEAGPRVVEVGDLLSVAGSLGHPLYWAGSRAEDRLELTQEPDGSVYLRYLPPGVEAGASPAAYLTVGTYPVANAQGALRSTAAQAGSSLSHVAGGGLVLVNPTESPSVYLAYPQSDLQLEVYDPAPGRAISLIRSGAIRPVG